MTARRFAGALSPDMKKMILGVIFRTFWIAAGTSLVADSIADVFNIGFWAEMIGGVVLAFPFAFYVNQPVIDEIRRQHP